MNIEEVMNRTEYRDIINAPELKGKMLFVTFGGSHAYGTNLPESDIDIRGAVLNSKQDLLGLGSFNQKLDEETDTCIYAFNKLISLLINCNPNTIELLGCRPDSYLVYSDAGHELLNAKNIFLSKRAFYSFGGYANSQLRRLQNALATDNYPADEKIKHIEATIKSSLRHFEERAKLIDSGMVTIKSGEFNGAPELLMDCSFKDLPVRDYYDLWSSMAGIIKNYDKLNNRNRKKDDLHLNKHAMHLVRLYLVCFDLLEKGEIITYREADHELLMAIRNGEYMREDGNFTQEFFDMLGQLDSRLAESLAKSTLPASPDYRAIDELVMGINERMIKGEIEFYGRPQRRM